MTVERYRGYDIVRQPPYWVVGGARYATHTDACVAIDERIEQLTKIYGVCETCVDRYHLHKGPGIVPHRTSPARATKYVCHECADGTHDEG